MAAFWTLTDVLMCLRLWATVCKHHIWWYHSMVIKRHWHKVLPVTAPRNGNPQGKGNCMVILICWHCIYIYIYIYIYIHSVCQVSLMVFKFDKLVKNCTWWIFNLTKWFVTLLSILDMIINDELKNWHITEILSIVNNICYKVYKKI